VLVEQTSIVMGGILAAAIGVMQQPRAGSAIDDGHAQRGDRQLY
jgi:hypothetical protein